MRKHLNTLFITLDDTYLAKDGAAVDVRFEKQSKLRVPLHNLDGIVTFGWNIACSPQLMAACAEAGLSISFHNPYGKFLAAVRGKVCGNVLLRREQFRRSDCEQRSLEISKYIIAAKLANSRTVMRRALRDHHNGDHTQLKSATAYLTNRLQETMRTQSLDQLRGVEGESAAAYFGAFPHMLTGHDPAIQFKGRSRRPPLDQVNALLSFLYSLLTHDCRSACESVGLDPQVGFLHRDRPGRASLALDLMEEFRAPIADRMALNLLNRKQLTSKDFEIRESGAVSLKENSRKVVLKAYQERKQDEIMHPLLGEKITIGLLPQIQARLLARHLRGDIDAYPAFIWK